MDIRTNNPKKIGSFLHYLSAVDIHTNNSKKIRTLRLQNSKEKKKWIGPNEIVAFFFLIKEEEEQGLICPYNSEW